MRYRRHLYGLLLHLAWSCCLLVATAAMSNEPVITHQVHAQLDRPFSVCPRHPWIKTAIQLKKGETYTISAVASGDYKDLVIPANADGVRGLPGKVFDLSARTARWWNPLTWSKRLGVTKRLRILRDGSSEHRRATFLTLIATIGQDDRPENSIVIGKERRFVAHQDGPLYLFANDWPGGTGTEGDARYLRTKKDGTKEMPTYDNNNGTLTVTVHHHPSQPR